MEWKSSSKHDVWSTNLLLPAQWHGNVVALTDSTGVDVNTYVYDTFGNLVHQTGTVVNPYLYAGYRFDKETGLYYLQARYYQPSTGAFLTIDPDPGQDMDPTTQNGYNYVDQNPIMATDSNGQSWIMDLLDPVLSPI